MKTARVDAVTGSLASELDWGLLDRNYFGNFDCLEGSLEDSFEGSSGQLVGGIAADNRNKEVVYRDSLGDTLGNSASDEEFIEEEGAKELAADGKQDTEADGIGLAQFAILERCAIDCSV